MVRFAINTLFYLATLTVAVAVINHSTNICICDRMEAPVCGSDGKTYGNLCLLECESEKLEPGSLTVMSRTSCEEFYSNGNSNPERQCVCTRFGTTQVCGSNGKTYETLCDLECENQLTHQELKVVHLGECGSLFFPNEV